MTVQNDDTFETNTAADADLILRTRSGDKAAFGELWRRHYRSGVAVARSVTSSIDPDDLVQESYTRIYQAVLKGGGPNGSFRAYLFTSIRNTAAAWGRSRRETTMDELDAVPDPDTTEQATNDALDRGLTAQAFRSLPTRWQEVLWYTEIEQMKPAEVAPLLGMKSGAVSQLAFRAREGLRESWIQAHLRSAEPGSECQWTIEHLGAHARGNLSGRDQQRLDLHVEDCARCMIVAAEANDVSNRLALVLLPLVLGVAGAAGYTAILQGGGAPIVALAAMPASVMDGAVAVGGAATSATGGAGVGGATGGISVFSDKSGSAGGAGGAPAGGAAGGAGASGGAVTGIGALVGVGSAALLVAGVVAAAVIVPGLVDANPVTSMSTATDAGGSSITTEVTPDDALDSDEKYVLEVAEGAPKSDAPVAPETPAVESEDPAAPDDGRDGREGDGGGGEGPTQPEQPETPAVPVPEPTDVPEPEPSEVPVPEPSEVPVPEPSEVPEPEQPAGPSPEPEQPAAPEPKPEEPAVPETPAPVGPTPTPTPTQPAPAETQPPAVLPPSPTPSTPPGDDNTGTNPDDDEGPGAPPEEEEEEEEEEVPDPGPSFPAHPPVWAPAEQECLAGEEGHVTTQYAIPLTGEQGLTVDVRVGEQSNSADLSVTLDAEGTGTIYLQPSEDQIAAASETEVSFFYVVDSEQGTPETASLSDLYAGPACEPAVEEPEPPVVDPPIDPVPALPAGSPSAGAGTQWCSADDSGGLDITHVNVPLTGAPNATVTARVRGFLNSSMFTTTLDANGTGVIELRPSWDQLFRGSVDFYYVAGDQTGQKNTVRLSSLFDYKVCELRDEAPAADEPVVEEPIVEEPAAEEPATNEPVADAPVADGPFLEEPIVEEPAAEEPSAEEPIVEEPVAEEPATDEPATDELVVEQPLLTQPATIDPPSSPTEDTTPAE